MADGTPQPSSAAPSRWVPPEPSRSPDAAGTLHELPPIQLLLWMHRQQETGQLFVEVPGWTIRIDLARGVPVQAGGGPGETTLGQVLIKLGALDAPRLAALVAEGKKQAKPVPLGDLGVRLGYVTPAQVLQAVRAQLEAKVRWLLTFEEGRYRLYRDERALQFAQTERLPLGAVIEETLRGSDELRTRVLDGFVAAHGRRGVRARPDALELLPLFHFGGKAQRLVRLLDGRRLEDAIAGCALPAGDAQLMVYLLWAAGGVELLEETSAREPAAEPAAKPAAKPTAEIARAASASAEASPAAPEPASAADPLEQASDLIADGSYADAVALLVAAGKRSPEDPAILAALAWATFLARGRSVEGAAQAHSIVGRALAADASHVPSHVVLGKVARLRGQLDEARGHFQRALDLDGSHEEARRELQMVRALSGEVEAGPRKKPPTPPAEAKRAAAPDPAATGGFLKRLFGQK